MLEGDIADTCGEKFPNKSHIWTITLGELLLYIWTIAHQTIDIFENDTSNKRYI